MGERHIGLDFLRIFAMYAIVCDHYLAHGGFLTEAQPFSTVWYEAWLFNAFVRIGVNVFVIISGYFLVDGTRFSFKKVMKIWLQIASYSVMICFIASQFQNISARDIALSFFPIKFPAYWFPPVYLALYLLSPYLGVLGRVLSKEHYKAMLITMLGLFSVYSFYTNPFREMPGSVMWFIVLFMIGGYIRRFPINIKKKYCATIYFGSSLFLFLLQVCLYKFNPIFGAKIGGSLFQINSPLLVLSSIALFLFFLFLRIYSPLPTRGGQLAAGATFGVYLIHENQYIYPRFWRYVCTTEAYFDSLWFPVHFLVCTIGMYVACTILELLRQRMFSGFMRLAVIVKEVLAL